MFNSIKCRALHLLHTAISRFWVRPIEEGIIPILENKSCWPAKTLLRWSTWCADAGRVIVNETRPQKIRWIGPDWSVTYLGNQDSVEFLCHELFPVQPEEVENRCIYLWQVPALARKAAAEGDLVVSELNRIVCLSPEGTDLAFTAQQKISQVIVEFDRPLDEIMADFQPHIRKRIGQLEEQGYSYDPSHSEVDFDRFYHQMYIPYILGRHGGSSIWLSDYDIVFRYFKEGVLILAKLDHEPIAGGILKKNGDSFLALQMGVLDGQFERVKQGSNVALWWFEILWAHQQGARRFELGESFPLITNGPFNFKRQWGTHVLPNSDNHKKWSFIGKSLNSQLRKHVSDLGFITEIDGKYYQVLLHSPAEPVDEAKLANQLYHLSRCGIAGMLLISEEGEMQLLQVEAVRQDPTGRRYLAVPLLAAR